MVPVVSRHKGGNVCVVSGDLTRYAEFQQALAQLKVPSGTAMHWAAGNMVAENGNRVLASSVQHGGDWIWFIGDDHVFDPDIILNLLDREVDVVIPLCLTRHPPIKPTFWLVQDGHTSYHPRLMDIPTTGLIEVFQAGDAGLLARMNVIHKIGPIWYETVTGTKVSEDILFTRKIREKGFKVHVDLDHSMGHINHLAIWPRLKDDKWEGAFHYGQGKRVGTVDG